MNQNIILHLRRMTQLPTPRGLEWTFSCYCCNNNNTFFHFPPILSHLHPLQVENCDSNSRLVVDEDDNGLKRWIRLAHHLPDIGPALQFTYELSVYSPFRPWHATTPIFTLIAIVNESTLELHSPISVAMTATSHRGAASESEFQ